MLEFLLKFRRKNRRPSSRSNALITRHLRIEQMEQRLVLSTATAIETSEHSENNISNDGGLVTLSTTNAGSGTSIHDDLDVLLSGFSLDLDSGIIDAEDNVSWPDTSVVDSVNSGDFLNGGIPLHNSNGDRLVNPILPPLPKLPVILPEGGFVSINPLPPAAAPTSHAAETSSSLQPVNISQKISTGSASTTSFPTAQGREIAFEVASTSPNIQSNPRLAATYKNDTDGNLVIESKHTATPDSHDQSLLSSPTTSTTTAAPIQADSAFQLPSAITSEVAPQQSTHPTSADIDLSIIPSEAADKLTKTSEESHDRVFADWRGSDQAAWPVVLLLAAAHLASRRWQTTDSEAEQRPPKQQANPLRR